MNIQMNGTAYAPRPSTATVNSPTKYMVGLISSADFSLSVETQLLDIEVVLPIDGSNEVAINGGQPKSSHSDTSTVQDTPQGSSNQSIKTYFRNTATDGKGSSTATVSISKSRSFLSTSNKDDDLPAGCPQAEFEDCFAYFGTQFEKGPHEGSLDASIDGFESACDEVLKECGRTGQMIRERLK